jgi:hypothetical protein
MDDLFSRGLIELAGPFADGTGALGRRPFGVGGEVRGWFEDDPWSVHDVLPVADVLEDDLHGQPDRLTRSTLGASSTTGSHGALHAPPLRSRSGHGRSCAP